MAVERAKKVSEEGAHVASALASELEVGLDRIDSLRLLNCLCVFELLDENVLDVDGHGVEEVERVCKGLSGVADECLQDIAELSATQSLRRRLAFGGQCERQGIDVVHIHVLRCI